MVETASAQPHRHTGRLSSNGLHARSKPTAQGDRGLHAVDAGAVRASTVCLLAILADEVGWLVIAHKDRLLRFGAQLVFAICEAKKVEVVILNQGRGHGPLRK